MSQFMNTRIEDGIGILTLDRQETMNAWHLPMRKEITEALLQFNADDTVRAVILTGAGDRAWSAGQDLNETRKIVGGEDGAAWAASWREFYDALRLMDKGTVAALNGVAAGSAFQFAMQCDILVGHAGSRMGQPEINSGIASIMGPYLMSVRIGRSRTAELALRGRMMPGTEAHEIGLIHYLVEPDQVMPKAMEVARLLASKPPLALKLTKQYLRQLVQAGYDDVNVANKRYQAESYASGEPQRVMAEFFEERAKRKAQQKDA